MCMNMNIFPPSFCFIISWGKNTNPSSSNPIFNWLLRKNEERKTHQEVAKSEWIA
jgi:hypothetical protein